MIRLILVGVAFYFLYKLLKEAVTPGPGPSFPRSGNNPDTIDDVMVKDPQCQVYFPLREGVEAVVDGKKEYFCSKECRDKYLAGRG